MKLFFGEFKANYGKYHFPYQVWLILEKNDGIEKVYNAGFLPMRNTPDVYYLSRSVRVDLEKFVLSSENRRIINKTADFEYQLLPLGAFEYTSQVQKFCKDYMDQRFKKGQISAAGIKSIFLKGVYTHVFVWRKTGEERPVGYAICFINHNLLQYAHAFYDLDFFEQSLGARMMLEAIIWAKSANKRYVYLGTIYDKNAFYKTEFSGIEFFNGFYWSNNLEELKELVDRKKEVYLLRDQEYLQKFYQANLLTILNKYGVRVNL